MADSKIKSIATGPQKNNFQYNPVGVNQPVAQTSTVNSSAQESAMPMAAPVNTQPTAEDPFGFGEINAQPANPMEEKP